SPFVTSTPAPAVLRRGSNVPYGASFRSNAVENTTISHNTNNGYHLSAVNQSGGQQIYHQSMIVAGGDLNLSSSVCVGQKAAGGSRLATGQQYEVRFSDRHNSYYLYFSRIMSLLWQTPVVNERTIPYTTRKTIDVLDCTFSSDEVACFLEQIHNFVNFMKATANLPPSVIQYSDDINSPYRDTAYETVSKNLNDAQYAEQQSLVSLFFLASKFSEVLGFLKILIDHQMHIIVALLPKDQQEKLRLMTFDRLVIDGQQICSDLVLCLMNQYLSDKATTDAISGRLRQVCPSLFTSDDATST
uniref:Nucleoporin Nup133/Nup155-like C-terminal domain-containing protein n=1 Tax=Romanomermis culicivorax TaxID=13658 RepID=A0A915KM36_ROMCU